MRSWPTGGSMGVAEAVQPRQRFCRQHTWGIEVNSVVDNAEQRERIPIDAWQALRPGHPVWHRQNRRYEHTLEACMVQVEPLPPRQSIELHTTHCTLTQQGMSGG